MDLTTFHASLPPTLHRMRRRCRCRRCGGTPRAIGTRRMIAPRPIRVRRVRRCMRICTARSRTWLTRGTGTTAPGRSPAAGAGSGVGCAGGGIAGRIVRFPLQQPTAADQEEQGATRGASSTLSNRPETRKPAIAPATAAPVTAPPRSARSPPAGQRRIPRRRPPVRGCRFRTTASDTGSACARRRGCRR